MADFDLFDLLGLAFDPPETNAKLVKKKIDQIKAELGSSLGRETQQTKRDAIQEQIDFLDQISSQILSPDGKKIVDTAFKPLAEKKTNDELRTLAATVELLALTGSRTVTEATIKHYRKETRLSADHVKKVFTDAGFEIISVDALAAYPKFPTNADRIYNELAALRKAKDPNPNGADNTVAVDLYAFAAYISNDTGNIPMYHAMATKELWNLFDQASRRFSQRNDDLGKLCGSLTAAGKSYVFNSDENRAAYDLHLKYCSPDLVKLFSTLKNIPKDTLRTSKFAEPCIKMICNYFPNYETALAIYNKEAALDPPYLPKAWIYTIKCSFCEHLNEFDSEAEAIKVNSCHNCKKPLYKKCEKCGKPVPQFMDTCPHCNYVFASAALFSKYYQQAESSLRSGDFDSARQYLFQAQSAAPGEKTRVDQLSKQIDQQEAILKEPVNRLRQLIAARKYQTARSEIGPIISKYPSLNVSQFEQTIKTELTKADQLFASAQSLPTSQKANVCVSILLQCVDYAPAIAFLQATPPQSCGSITVTPESNSGAINISWNRSSEQGISYRLIRKNGNTGSTSENDGVILANNIPGTSFTDKNAIPGIVYTYSVFVSRMDVYSTPVSKAGILFADVSNCRLAQRNSSVRLTWDAPQNSQGATILRECNGQTVTLTVAAHGSYDDNSTEFGKTYTYTVCANYSGNKRSSGIRNIITPLPSVDSFTINGNLEKENNYKLSWSIRSPGIALRITVNGDIVADAKSEDKEITFSLPRNTYCSICVLAYSENKWIPSANTIELNTFTACSIDKKNTELHETLISGRAGDSYHIDLKIRLTEPIPAQVSGFYYTARTAKSPNRWASVNDIGRSGDILPITTETYKSKGYMAWQDSVKTENAFFVSVFTCYKVTGKEIISEPQRMRIDRPLEANLFWNVTHSFLESPKLVITLSGNRPIEYVPELLLRACDQKQFIAAYDDKKGQDVMHIPSVELETPTVEYRKTYPLRSDLPIKYLKKCKYFLFNVDTSCNDKITLRWDQGLSG